MNRLLAPTYILLAALALLTGCARSPEARRDQHLARGKQLLEKKDYSRALLEFKSASQAMPNDAEPYYQFGIASLATGDFQSGVRSLKKALGLNPQHAGAQLKMAQLMASTRDRELLQDAEGRLRDLLSKGSSVETLTSLALTEAKLGNIEEGTQHLEQTLAQSPGHLSSAILLAKAKLWQKDVNSAEQVLIKASEDAPRSPEAQTVLARFYVDQKRFADAEERISKTLALDPNNGPALMLLGRLQLVAGKKQEAEQTFRKLGGIGGYRSIYAIFLFQDGRRDESIREFERLSKEDPDDRLIRTQLVVAYRAVNRKDDATRILNEALKKNGNDGEALLQRSELLLEAGKVVDAEQDVNRVLTLRPTASEAHYVLAKVHLARGATLRYRQELGEALRLNPGLEAVRIELARNLMGNNGAKAALDILNAAPPDQQRSLSLQVQRNWAYWALGDMASMRKGIDAGLSIARAPDFLIQDGIWKLRAGNATAARASLEEALKINPGDVRALQFLSQTYLAMKDPRGALQKVREYAAQQPKSAPVQHFLGTLLMANSDKAGARTAFVNARAVNPGFVNADLSLAQMDMLDQKYDDAGKKLEEILTSDKNNLTARLWLANIQLVRGDAKTSADNYRQVIAADPRHAEAMNNLAWLLAENGAQMDEALKYAEKAVELDPSKADFNDTLGWVLYKKGVYGSAVKYLERADKGHVAVKYHLAMAYAKAGDVNRGRSTLEAALKINPNAPEAKLATQVVTGAQ